MKLTQKEKARAFAALRRLLKGPHWEALNERRSELIPGPDCPELSALQALADLRRLTLAPYPVESLQRLHRRVSNTPVSNVRAQP
tara:strand:+ start:1023 stop:1277 length:255 start_codon:yes stop_codon:yes gene_type:complete